MNERRPELRVWWERSGREWRWYVTSGGALDHYNAGGTPWRWLSIIVAHVARVIVNRKRRKDESAKEYTYD